MPPPASPVVVSVALVVVACSKREPSPSTPRAPAVEQKAPPANQPVPGRAVEPGTVDVSGDPAQVGRRLADAWCAQGGEVFGPPGASDDDHMPLEACLDIAVYVLDQTRADGVTATVLGLDAIWETRDVLLIQHPGPGDAMIVDLAHVLADQSGEIDEPTHSYEGSELRDVFGGPGLEWVSTYHEVGGDSFEADRCHSNVDESRGLIVCSPERADDPCFEVTYTALQTSSPRSADQLYDCDMPRAELEPTTVMGFDQTIDVRHDEVEFVPRRSTKIDEKRTAPREGVVPMEVLFRDDAFSGRLDE